MASVFFFAIMTSAIMSILAVKYLCKFMFYFPALGYILRSKILESKSVCLRLLTHIASLQLRMLYH